MQSDASIPSDMSTLGWNFDNTYTRLPKVLFEEVEPSRFRAPDLVVLNHALADEMGLSLNELSPQEAAAIFAGQILPPGAQPIAQAYAGHQFGGFTMLGDGRAILLGEQVTPAGDRFDVQFKGSGQTRYSRRGDGRAALGPMLREYIISEAMHALGIPTTRSLAVVTTGEPVYRETTLQGAVLTRIASSHIRVGTFQFVALHKNEDVLRTLADYTIERHDPEFADGPDKYLRWLNSVMLRQARLIARWQSVGFVHGVMNTDNMAISGETIDYGPCAFMDTYHPATVFSSIDHGGRYAYGNQPAISQWNLARFAETLIPLIDEDHERAIEMATDALNGYPEMYQQAWLEGMQRKLGLTEPMDGDASLIDELLGWMASAEVDFTNGFDDLTMHENLNEGVYDDPRFRNWHRRWQERIEQSGSTLEAAQAVMRRANPSVIPRNHRVEEALAAAEDGDLSVMNRLLEVLSRPYDRDESSRDYRDPPPPGQCQYQTFCGT